MVAFARHRPMGIDRFTVASSMAMRTCCDKAKARSAPTNKSSRVEGFHVAPDSIFSFGATGKSLQRSFPLSWRLMSRTLPSRRRLFH
jgi:hypothetical protein